MKGNQKRFSSRRRVLQAGILGGVGMALHGSALAAAVKSTQTEPTRLERLPSLITRPIPATGEQLPVIGIGTNAFRDANYVEIRDLLKRMHELGATLIDTAAAYGESEGVIGRALAELRLRERFFISTKFNAAGMGFGAMDGASGRESFERSMERLKGKSIDLLEVHRVAGLDELLPVMQEYKQAGRIRYLGVTTARSSDHEQMIAAMRNYQLDFIQIDYSLANRQAAASVFPVAQQRGVAVMIAVPLGGRRGSLFQEVAGRELPAWAAEFGAASWGQFFLKYVVSHPAVTCAIPGSTKLSHLEDNQAAGRGRLPNAAERKRMEEFWDGKAS